MEAPVLFIIFNRPDTTAQVFEAIRKAKPKKLYVSADAPRANNKSDKINCEKVRKIVKGVDWECDVHYRFLENNLGCGFGVSTAIHGPLKMRTALLYWRMTAFHLRLFSHIVTTVLKNI